MSAATTRWPWGTDLTTEDVRGIQMPVYAERARSLVEILDMSLRWGDREFLVGPEMRLSYRTHHAGVEEAARLLLREGVRAGDRILLLAANSVEWVVAFWAILRAGGVVVLGNGWWSSDEVRHAAALTAPVLAVTDARRAPALADLVPVRAVEELGSLIVGSTDCPLPPPETGEDDPAVILFTSGTSGPPKGAVLSHRSIIANQHNFLALTHRLPSQIGDDHPALRILLSAPLFHTGGVQAIMSAMLTGTAVVLLTGRFDPATVLETIERERISAWTGVPTAVQRVIEHPDALKRDLSSVVSLGMGGAPLPEILIARAAKAFPGVVRGVSTNYGMTEAGGIIASASGPEVTARPGTSGRVLPAVEVRIDVAHPAAGLVVDGEPGEILVRSAAVMSGYWGSDESPVGPDGWLHTGDVGRVDAEGYLFIVDRLKDIIIRAGENVASAHVEAALMEHPAVAAAAVLGLPHLDLGEEVAAVIAVRDGSPTTPEELRTFLAGRLAHFEVPSRWWLRSGPFPTTATDKTDKRALRAQWPDAAATA